MATPRNPKPTAPRKPVEPEIPVRAAEPLILRIFDEVYRFLASVKLAVICIATLAIVLGGATFFESSQGIPAVRQYVYGNPAFAILLAFLGTNIFCAATIRFPWKKRQTGFVVTHIGLLVVLAGAFVSLRYGDEGQLGMAEGTRSNELVRLDHSVVRVQKLDPVTKEWRDSRDFPFEHGAFRWNSEELVTLSKSSAYMGKVWAIRGAFFAVLALLVGYSYVWVVRRPKWLGLARGTLVMSLLIGVCTGLGVLYAMVPAGPRREVLTDPHDPYTIVATDYLASSGAEEARAEDDPQGYPAAKIALLAKPPGATEAIDGMQGQEWFAADPASFDRTTHDGTPASVAFQYVKGPKVAAIVDDFLNPPANPLSERVARIHYLDKSGKSRVYSWILTEDQTKKTIPLPDSDLAITLGGVYTIPADNELTAPLLGYESTPEGRERAVAAVTAATGESFVNLALFSAKKGDGPEGRYAVFGSLPGFTNSKGDSEVSGIQSIGYFSPPRLAAKGGGMGGRFAVIEVLRTDEGKTYARAFGRDGLMGKPGPIEIDKPLPLVAGARMPMQLSLRVDEFRPKVRIRKVFVHVDLPREQRDDAMPAVQLEMTVKGVTKPISVLRLNDVLGSRIDWVNVQFPDGRYRVAFDFDRSPFPFTLELMKFEPGKDPGSPTPATFRSDVKLSDPGAGLKDEPRAIYMNNPLTYKRWSFYQSNYRRVTDPETGQKDGAYASFFQVHFDPGWETIYIGCVLVVLGTFLQFYMRAGLFSDGGKRERERAESKLARTALASNGVSTHSSQPSISHVDTGPERFEDL